MDTLRRSACNKSEHNYFELHSQGTTVINEGAVSASSNMTSMLNEINGMSDELNKYPGNKGGREPNSGSQDEGQGHMGLLGEVEDNIFNRPIPDNLDDQDEWERIRSEHEQECDKINKE